MSRILWELFVHAYRWLLNLRRAGEQRKRNSVEALRDMITASRETAVYLRQIRDTSKPDHQTESSLTKRWTQLGFRLKDLGLTKLAKRCEITGKHWSDPDHYETEFLDKADISLERMEKLAMQILKKIEE